MPSRAAKHIWELGRDDRPRRLRRLDAVLWVAQALLALVFGIVGGGTLALSVAELTIFAPWARTIEEPTLSLIGAVELIGALGVIVPALTRVRPGFTAVAAIALFGVCLLSIAFHVHRGEYGKVTLPICLGLLALVVAWGRGWAVPIKPRPRPINLGDD